MENNNSDINIDIIDQFIEYITEINFELKIKISDFKYPINNLEHNEYSKLYFIEYKTNPIILINIQIDSYLKKILIGLIDYKNIIWKFDYVNSQIEYLNQIEKFITDMKLFSSRIITYNSIIKRKYRFYNIYPYMNKIYLRNKWKDKYCLCLILIDKFAITYNDEKEDFEEFNNYELLDKSEKLKIFIKNIFY